jgi:hypothetical protein
MIAFEVVGESPFRLIVGDESAIGAATQIAFYDFRSKLVRIEEMSGGVFVATHGDAQKLYRVQPFEGANHAEEEKGN